jgi:atypical dual specificity phosphatase
MRRVAWVSPFTLLICEEGSADFRMFEMVHSFLMNFFEKSAVGSVAVLLILGCGDAREPAVEVQPAPNVNASPVDPRLVPPTQGFSWIVPGELAAMPLPGRDRPLEQDAAFLEQEGIHVLVSLTENPPDSEVLASYAIDQEHIPVQDYTPPTLEQMIEFVAVVEDSVAVGNPVGVHCTAGLGRSGTMAAAYLVAEGASADEAIATVRQLRPGSIETSAQEDAVRLFEENLNGDR